MIPCYDEVASLPALLEALDGSRAELERAGHEVELLVVDDGSTDGSHAVLLEATGERDWMRVLR